MRKSLNKRIICCWLIINFIGGLLVPAAFAATGNNAMVLLCTLDGYQWVDSSDLSQDQSKTDFSLSAPCVFCLHNSDDFDEIYSNQLSLHITKTKSTLNNANTWDIVLERYIRSGLSRAPPSLI